MVVNGSKKNAEFSSIQYNCIECDFKCSKKSNFDKHLLTLKHLRHQNGSKKMPKNAETVPLVCICGRKYKYDSGYYRHKQKCKFFKEKEEEKEVYSENLDSIDYKDLFLKMIHENHELRKTMVTENQDLRKQITDLIPKVGNNNTNTINNKQRFNINIFLNEQCKDALTMNEFIDKIRVTLDNLLITKNKGLTEGVSNIFIENMNKLSLHERPMHCTDMKRETVYIKCDAGKDQNNNWEKDDENIKLKSALKKISQVQERNLTKWTEEHPNWKENHNLQQEYLILVKNCTDNLKENKREEKVIKKLCSNIYVGDNKL